MASFDTASLVAAIRVRAAAPSSGNQALTTAQILRLVDEELSAGIVPLIKREIEGYFQTSSSQSLVAAQSAYRIPTRSVGASVYQALYVDANGGETELVPLSRNQVVGWRSSTGATGTPTAFYLESGTINLVPTPDVSSGSLTLIYEVRPNRLVDSASAVGVITVIDTGTRQVTVSSAPAAWVSGATSYDFIKAGSPFDSLGVDQSATKSSNTLTFTNALPSSLAVGDYVALAGESPVPQIPQDLHPLLQARAVIAVLKTLGEDDGAVQSAIAGMMEIQAAATPILSPRVSGTPKKIVGGIHRLFQRRRQ
jgi:hypothetical protein